MRCIMIAVALCALARPTTAQLTTTYSGTQLVGDNQVAATAQFSIEDGRIVAIMSGSRGGRMIYDAKAEVLHVVSDNDKMYFDITKAGAASGDPMGMQAAMQKQLEKMPKEQRAAAEQMMKGMMGSSATQVPPLTYVWTHDTKTVAGYDCTIVEGMKGNDKVTEYCGSKSPDFTMSDAEHRTMIDMQGYLRNVSIMVKSDDEASRAFQWDVSTDGYPVITRCYRDGKLTLDLQLAAVSRKPVSEDLFKIPSGYKKMDMGSMGGGVR